MTDIIERYEKSIKTLELPAVLELLRTEAASLPAKEKASLLRPLTSTYEVKRRLGETSAAKEMMVLKGSPPFGGIFDVRASLSRAEIGGMLNTRELLHISSVLNSSRMVKAYASGSSVRTDIDSLFLSLMGNRHLEDKISSSITAEDEIADTASLELATIRRHIRAAASKVREELQRIISSPLYSKALQEPIITSRSGRYVVPIKADHKGTVPGLVHDISSSGATFFVEPMGAVKANNELRELRMKEELEIERILFELSANCGENAGNIIEDFNTLIELDLIFARAKLSYKLDCCEPLISERHVLLKRARHPLLPKTTVVPIDIELGGNFDTIVITGPNTGGKTVSLKTLGLLSIMAACGLHIPAADGSCVPVFSGVLADIGDEQSIEQSLSTFSSHMTNIIKILSCCDDKCLLLFDELGAGTDPVEGAALAMSIIENARRRGSLIAATTHYAELKVYATTTQGVQNASCEFDVSSLRPTFRLLIGIPGKSNAFAISERLGLPDNIIEDAKKRVSAETAKLEETILQLENQRHLLEKGGEELKKKLLEAEENLEKSKQLRCKLELDLEKAKERAQSEAVRIIEDARKTAEETFDKLGEMMKRRGRELDHIRENEARAELRRSLNLAESAVRKPKGEVKRHEAQRPVKAGDTVEILSMGVKAQVLSVSDDGQLTLQAGIMKVTLSASEVSLLESETMKNPLVSPAKGSTSLRAASVRPELDLRGQTPDDAVMILERYIDDAVMGKLENVTIIHGKGTGAVRSAVQQSLKKNKSVKSFRLGRFGEGEAGVTIVTIK